MKAERLDITCVMMKVMVVPESQYYEDLDPLAVSERITFRSVLYF